MSQPVVLATSRIPDDIADRISRFASLIRGSDPLKGMPRAEVLTHVGQVNAILNLNELTIDAALLDRAPRLKIVANATAGFDNMDVAAMRSRGVWGTNCPTSFAADTATHAMALLLAIGKRLFEGDRYVRSGRWKTEGWTPGGRWDGLSLGGKRLGLIGYGNIGREMEKRALAFGMTVHHHTRSGRHGQGWLPFEELIASSDAVSLHCPLTSATRHLINAAVLAAMKPTAILINVSRGPVVDINALVKALKTGEIAAAGLDVFEFEPDIPEELGSLGNVVLTPHMGGCSEASRQSAWEICSENIACVLSGSPPRTPAFALQPDSAPSA